MKAIEQHKTKYAAEARQKYGDKIMDETQSSLDPERDLYPGMVLDAMILRIEAELKWLERVENRLDHWKGGGSR